LAAGIMFRNSANGSNGRNREDPEKPERKETGEESIPRRQENSKKVGQSGPGNRNCFGRRLTGLGNQPAFLLSVRKGGARRWSGWGKGVGLIKAELGYRGLHVDKYIDRFSKSTGM